MESVAKKLFKIITAGFGLLFLSLPIGAVGEPAVSEGELALRESAIAMLRASFESVDHPGAAGLHQLVYRFHTLDANSQEYLLGLTADAFSTRKIPWEMFLALDPKGKEALVLSDRIVRDVAVNIKKERKAIVSIINDKPFPLVNGTEQQAQELAARMKRILPLYAMIVSKKKYDNLNSLCKEASERFEKLRAERIQREEIWTAEALKPDFAPGFDKDETFADGISNGNKVILLLHRLRTNTSSAGYDRRLNKKIVKAVLKNPQPEKEAMAIQELMDNIYTERPRARRFIAHAVSSAEKIAAQSLSPRVRGLAIALLLRQEKLRAISAAFPMRKRGMLAGMIARIAASEGRVVTKIPVVAKSPNPVPRIETPPLLAQAKEGMKTHPVGSAAALLKIASMALMPIMAHSSIHILPLLGLLLTMGIMSYVTIKGLWLHHPVANLFQLLLLGSMFKHFRVWAHEPASVLAVLLLGVGLQAAVALASYKKDRWILGWASNKALISFFAFAALALFHWLR